MGVDSISFDYFILELASLINKIMLLSSLFFIALVSFVSAAKIFKISIINPGSQFQGKSIASTKDFQVYLDINGQEGEEIEFKLEDSGLLYNTKNNHTLTVKKNYVYEVYDNPTDTHWNLDSDDFLIYQGEDFYACKSEEDGVTSFKLATECNNGTSISLKSSDISDIN